MVHHLLSFFVICIHFWGSGAIWNGDTVSEPVKYQVVLRKCGKVLGGGSILAPSLILTAAYAVRNANHKHLKVVVGTKALPDSSKSGKEYDVETIEKHEKYDARNRLYDIAVVVLRSAISQEDKDVTWTPVKLENGEIPPKDTPLTVRGWGQSSDIFKRSKLLLKANVKVKSSAECQQSYQSKAKRIYNNKLLFCAQGVPGKNICHGDVGGPIVNEAGVQVGIVSLDTACNTNFSGFYTNIVSGELWKWIDKWRRVRINEFP